MKINKAKNLTKQIICIIIVLMLCNFIIPNVTYGYDVGSGGSIFNPFFKFVTFLCDSVMQFLQNSFTSNQSIDNGDGTYLYQYSPGIIFSGTVQGLDINFITPNTDTRNINNYEAFFRTKVNEYDKADNWGADDNTYGESGKENYKKYLELKEKVENDNRYKGVLVEKGEPYTKRVYYYEENNVLYAIYFYEGKMGDAKITCHLETSYQITSDFLKELNSSVSYTSIASELQPTIATWYNALRRIALVGLLSVLVYVGIRVILSSNSAEGNSKYKKMLTDWLVALCLLFTLHYLMNLILVVTNAITDIFDFGYSDKLLGELRQKIAANSSWGEALGNVIIYVVLTIYSVTFTFQYLKRVLYMAFFTLIAPLITLTYPIDKVKDGKAQAFTMWIREYIFNALIQVVHLLIYVVLVDSAMELVTLYPIYAVVAIGFITQAEKIIRSMFGFNNATTVGTLGAAATGGLVATAMNKLKSLPKPSAKGKGESGDNSADSNNKVRTASRNPLESLQQKNGKLSTGNTSTQTGSETENSSVDEKTGQSGEPSRSLSGGAGSILKKYTGPSVKKIFGATSDLFLGGTGALIGLAAGVAQGDVGSAFSGALAGAAAGKGLRQGVTNKAVSMGNSIKNFGHEFMDTAREGAYGAEYAEMMKFKRTSD